jgi:hypothetical protein
MLRPLVGFISGYALIVLFFGAWYFATYIYHADWFMCASAEPTAATVQAVPCKESPKPPNESDFMYFSINTALPLGYSRIKPADGAEQLQWATAAELVAGASWIVVVFAAMLHALQEQMIQKATQKQMRQLVLELQGRTQPVPSPEAGPSVAQRQASRGGWIALGVAVLLAGGGWVAAKPPRPIILVTPAPNHQITLGSLDEVDLTITNKSSSDLRAVVVYLDGADDWFRHHLTTNASSCAVNTGLERLECGGLRANQTMTLVIAGQATHEGYWKFEADVVDQEGSDLVHPGNSTVDWSEYITRFDPHEVMIQSSDLPPGYTMTQDGVVSPGTNEGIVNRGPIEEVPRLLGGSSAPPWYGWHREFTWSSDTHDFYYVTDTVWVLPSGTDPGSAVSDSGCDLTFGSPSTSSREIPAPASGSSHKACLYKFPGRVADWTEYMTADKFAFVDVAIEPDYADDTTALNEAVMFARQQLLEIESQAR